MTGEMRKRVQTGNMEELLRKVQNLSLDLSLLQTSVRSIIQGTPSEQYSGLHHLRMILSLPGDIPIQPVIDTGIVPHLVEVLRSSDDANCLFEAAWVLTNVASGSPDQTRVVIDAGGIFAFVRLLGHPIEDIREQGMWGLGNIVSDRKFDSLHLDWSEIFEQFQMACNHTSRDSAMKTAVWAMSCLCRSTAKGPIGIFARYLLWVLGNTMEADVLSNACLGLEGIWDREHTLQMGDALPRLVELLSHPLLDVQHPALRLMGDLLTGSDCDTQTVLDAGGLSALILLLDSSRDSIRREACWALSNVTAGTTQQIEQVIECGAIPKLLVLLDDDVDMVKREAGWAICNACTGANAAQLRFLVQQGSLRGVVKVLKFGNQRMMALAHGVLRHVLQEVKDVQGVLEGININ